MNVSLALEVFQSLMLVGCFAVLLVKRGGEAQARAMLGQEYARVAVSHAKRMGGDRDAQLRTALSAFRLADETTDGKRDFSDAQARVYIEAAFAES